MRNSRFESNPQGQVEARRVEVKARGVRCLVGPVATGLWLVTFTLPFCGTVGAQQSGTVMLVRDWNSATGSLIGWLPTHSLEMDLVLVGHQKKTEFDPDEAVTIVWTKGKDDMNASAGDVNISPAVREFEGMKWLPLLRDANVVRIKTHLFLIKQIVFEASPHRIQAKAAHFKRCSSSPASAKAFAGGCGHGQGE